MTNATVTVGTPSPAPQRLVATLGGLGLFGRILLVMLGELLIVPMPWVTTIFYRYLCGHLALPDGRGLKFAGKPGDIWYILIGIPLILWAMQGINIWHLQSVLQQRGRLQGVELSLSAFLLVAELAMFYLGFLALRWAITQATSEDGSVKLSFAGGFWTLVGWTLLVGLAA